MIIRGSEIPAPGGRRPYPLEGRVIPAAHFVERVTTPDNPFGPHSHEKPELWYVTAGSAWVTLGEKESAVGAGDLIVIDPWVVHGLRSDSQATWLCLG